MKNLLILFAIMAATITAGTGCKDKCKDVVCLNDGKCEDGNCLCTEGYTGENCETCQPSHNTVTTEECLDQYSYVYLQNYFDTIKVMTNNFDVAATATEVTVAHEFGASAIETFCCCNDTIVQIDLTNVMEQAQFDATLSHSERDDYIALNNWVELVSPSAYPGVTHVVACE